MQWLWTWGGQSFGYRDGDELWTQDGQHVGRFHGEEVYGKDGRYLGELRGDDRLITVLAKKGRRQSSFSPWARVVGTVPYVNYVGFVMYVGCEDFPEPKALK